MHAPLKSTLFLLALASCNASEERPAEARLYDGFGGYRRAITTPSNEAQRWFDQGMQLLYGFNHDEAIRSFQRAAELDPRAAMPEWGVAYANGFHINKVEMSAASSEAAYEAAQRALSKLDDESAAERDLVRAVARRYAWPVPEDRSALDQDYADAMEAAWRAHPRDPNVGALFAESLMDLQPWDLWTKEGEPKKRAAEIIAVLEAVIRLDPQHPGANHFYIHAVEASPDPARAVAAADRLSVLVPGSGHLVHMPSHIYTRVGRYADAVQSNERAIAADRAYFALAPEPDFYNFYYVHNVHFLAYAAMMEGRAELALAAARRMEREVPDEFVRGHTAIADGLMATPLHVLVRFGRWQAILEEPEAPDFRLLSRAERHYARGVALAALGRPADARTELARFEELAAQVPADWKVGNNSAGEVLELSRRMLHGELAFREGRHDEAFAELEAAVALEDALVYDEPPGWMQPVRHALGALLLAAGRAEQAEAVYRADLEHNPENGWGLLGLEQALVAQSDPEASEIATRRARAWARADVQPPASCYCAEGTRAAAPAGTR